MKKSDFTSANTFPSKIFHNQIIQGGKIIPYHVTLIPTNICNANCLECFCDKRDKHVELPYGEALAIVDMLKDQGTRAISLSGGGEPDCYNKINELLTYIHESGTDIAMTSNGIGLHRLTDETLNRLSWIRVSGTTSRPVNIKKFLQDYKRGSKVDWGFSYVVGKDDNGQGLADMINFVNEYKLTHMRVVSNMREPNYNYIPRVKMLIKQKGIDDDRVVWQERENNEQGRHDCKVGLLHPVIDANGYVQPCCGVHFSTEPPTHDFNKQTAYCHWREFPKVIKEQRSYDGDKCKICQYGEYNRGLDLLLEKPVHKNFV